MYCRKCGANLLGNTNNYCPYCGEKINVTPAPTIENKNTDQKSQTFLIIGIILAFCCSLPFGVAVVLINEYKYKPQLKEGNLQEANKTKNLMTVLIIIGLLFGVFVSGLSFLLEFLTAFE